MRCVVASFMIFLSFTTSFLAQAKEVKIAFVSDGPSARLHLLEAEMQKEITDLIVPEFSPSFIPFNGDWSIESIQQATHDALSDDSVDLVVMIGPIGSEMVSREKKIPKPVIAPFIVDRTLQNLPETKEETSGVKNLNYLTFPSSVFRDLRLLQGLTDIKHVAFLSEEAAIRLLPEAFEKLRDFAKEVGLEVSVVAAKNSAETVLKDIPQGVDAVYVAPLPRFDEAEIKKLSDGFICKGLKSFSLFSKGYVDQGMLASMSPDSELERLSRRIALNVQSILLGEDPGNFSVVISDGQRLSVNVKTAECLGISLPWEVLLEAELVDVDKLLKRPKLGLVQAVEDALVANPNLDAVWQEVLVGVEEVNRARSRLRMQVDLNSLSRIIDKDRAIARTGFEPQAAVFGTVSAAQMIYSNELIGDVRVQKFLQKARCENYQSQKLDLIFETARAYLNILRDQTVEDVQKNNLKLTAENLQTAKRRVRVGVARLSEVYRWESQLSDDRSNVVDAHFQTLSSNVVLSRLLSRPNEAFNLVNVTVEEPYWLLEKQWKGKQLNTPRKLEKFTEFSVWEGIHYSPEIRELQENIFAQNEVLGIRTRAFWQPDVFVVGEVRDRFASGGAGRRFLLSDFNTTEWLFGVDVTFPLYQGGEKAANQRQACQELRRLRYLMTDLINRVEEEIRVNINRSSASFASIELARVAAEAAKKNLNLVLEGYAKGTENILDLLDAQNQALNSELLAVNAVYDFLIDALAVQRSIGRFDFLMTPSEQWQWVTQLERFMHENAVY